MKVESIQKKILWVLLSTIALILLSGCLPGLSGPELPEEPGPSPTSLLAEVLMRIQLDYLGLEQLNLSELQEAALLGDTVVLCDTVGMATPQDIQAASSFAFEIYGDLALHLLA